MTDANGSATAEKPDAGTPETTNGSGDQGSTAATPDPFAGLDTGTREWVETNGLKDVQGIVAKARNAESLIGRSVQLPGDDAKPEDVEKFLDKATAKFVPETADGYAFKLPDGLPEGMPYDAAFASEFKAWAHELRLPASKVAKLHDKWVQKFATDYQAQGEAFTAKVKTATAALEKEYGGALDSEPFNKGIEITSRAITQVGGEDLMKALQDAGLVRELPEQGFLVLNPVIATAFYRVGNALFKEDGLERGGGAAVVNNPFKDGPDKGNQTEQMLMVKNNRAEAERLMRLAGYTPEQFGLKTPAAA